jgi:cytochrome c-type biogenesis protein CcmE
MKPRLIVGLVLLVGFTSLLMLNFSSSIDSYVNFEQAESAFGRRYVIGTWEKDLPMGFDMTTKSFYFHMKDEAGNVRKVVYNKAKPANFEDATQVVVKGKLQSGVFYSDDMLVKCPSKYNDAKVIS